MSWQVLQTKGEYEPWWFFEEWRETITKRYEYTNKQDALIKYQKVKNQLLKAYPEHQVKQDVLMAFWNEDEQEYCEDCEEDIQTFHGLLLLSDEKVYLPTEEERQTIFALERV